jgi:hypothetical protein
MIRKILFWLLLFASPVFGANELRLSAPSYTGAYVYAIISNQSNQYYDAATPGMETYSNGEWATYDYPTDGFTENSGSGTFVENFPTLAAGRYYVEYRERSGATPALTDSVIATQTIDWEGDVESITGDIKASEQLNVIPVSPVVRSNTAAGGGATTITLDSGANQTADYYNGMFVEIVSGTGVDQRREIYDYAAGTEVASVTPAWATIPDNTSKFRVVRRKVEGAIASGTTTSNGTTTTAIDSARLESVDANHWRDQRIVFTSGLLVGQSRRIIGSTTTTLRFAPPVTQTVVSGTTYEILPGGP